GSEKLALREVFTSVQDNGSLSGYIRTYVFESAGSGTLSLEQNRIQRALRAYTSVTQNNLQELKEIWPQWDDEVKQLFYYNYEVDLVPTIEEYTALLRCPRIQADKVYSKVKNVPTFVKKLMNILGIIHPDTKKKVDVFALSIYGLMIFPRALGYIDEALQICLIDWTKESHLSQQFWLRRLDL
ncbi:hypothetical protein Goshw_018072, partial [Gossypium schwendimanii]|nr:hypothetical protein [Gossypium schwendimanii]